MYVELKTDNLLLITTILKTNYQKTSGFCMNLLSKWFVTPYTLLLINNNDSDNDSDSDDDDDDDNDDDNNSNNNNNA